jgi:hypothetical protein
VPPRSKRRPCGMGYSGSPVILIDWRIKKEDIPLNGTHAHIYIYIHTHICPILYSGQGERDIYIYVYNHMGLYRISHDIPLYSMIYPYIPWHPPCAVYHPQ